MYKKINYITAVLVLLASISVNAQVTTQSPYSKYGVGTIPGSLLPQLRAMGGISAAVSRIPGSNVINMANPSSYANIGLTTIDVGISVEATTLSNGSTTDHSFNGTLSHIALAFPVTSHSALSFGILPYSNLGYRFSEAGTLTSTSGTGNPASANINSVYSGEGGLTKAYIGYGYRIGDNFRIGANIEYIFGDQVENRAVEYPDSGANALGAQLQTKNSVGGISFSYGAQYDIHLNSKTFITLGYSGSSASTLNSTKTMLATSYFYSGTTGENNVTVQTIDSAGSGKQNLKLPLTHDFGISFNRLNQFIFGADFRMGQWAKYSIGGVNQGLTNSWGASVGGQFTPDITSINSYWSRVDYRFGLSYDKTYIQVNGNDVKEESISFGLGLPLARAQQSRNAFYKMNLGAEYGKIGTMVAGDLKQSYVNIHLGFTINDRWFQRFKFD
ncbi:hypothetical protein [Pedobacter sp. L105]|uniref:hypothetical protein n=1 Tax=Pedobacter sp. L105 TaxID=1641871 RepID=UPI00131DAA4D|nr:hypothetical protein [Pedobacter sp. L105]